MRMSLELDPTPDILAEVGKKKGDRLLIGFAAETENLVEEARRKLQQKNCDMVVANLVYQDGTGFESDENEVVLVLRTGETIPRRPRAKREIADVSSTKCETAPGTARRPMTARTKSFAYLELLSGPGDQRRCTGASHPTRAAAATAAGSSTCRLEASRACALHRHPRQYCRRSRSGATTLC